MEMYLHEGGTCVRFKNKSGSSFFIPEHQKADVGDSKELFGSEQLFILYLKQFLTSYR